FYVSTLTETRTCHFAHPPRPRPAAKGLGDHQKQLPAMWRRAGGAGYASAQSPRGRVAPPGLVRLAGEPRWYEKVGTKDAPGSSHYPQTSPESHSHTLQTLYSPPARASRLARKGSHNPCLYRSFPKTLARAPRGTPSTVRNSSKVFVRRWTLPS